MNKEELLKKWNNGILRGSQAKLAEKLAVASPTISEWISGKKSPSEENIKKMSKIFNNTEEEIKGIFGISDRRSRAKGLSSADFIAAEENVPIRAIIEEKNGNFILQSKPETTLMLKKSHPADFAIKMIGDSMVDVNSPHTSIYPGDYIIITPIESMTDLDNGQNVLVQVDDNFITVKRYYKTDGKIELLPDNPKYKPLKYDLYNVKLLGYVSFIYRQTVKPRYSLK